MYTGRGDERERPVADDLLIGVISDTHGLLRPEAVEALRGCALIIHAGDVGALEILDTLREIAPVVAVRGTVDGDAVFGVLREREVVEIAQHRIYVLHDLAQFDRDPVADRLSAVITGHSHVPRIEHREGVLFLNPGSAGPRRFKLPITLAHVSVVGGRLRAELIDLTGAGLR
jgi:putative phosphoesterase